MLSPVELTAVYDNATDCCAMATDPLRRRMDDNVSSMLDGLNEVTTSSESIINLFACQRL